MNPFSPQTVWSTCASVSDFLHFPQWLSMALQKGLLCTQRVHSVITNSIAFSSWEWQLIQRGIDAALFGPQPLEVQTKKLLVMLYEHRNSETDSGSGLLSGSQSLHCSAVDVYVSYFSKMLVPNVSVPANCSFIEFEGVFFHLGKQTQKDTVVLVHNVTLLTRAGYLEGRRQISLTTAALPPSVDGRNTLIGS